MNMFYIYREDDEGIWFWSHITPSGWVDDLGDATAYYKKEEEDFPEGGIWIGEEAAGYIA